MNRLSNYKHLDIYVCIFASIITVIYACIQIIHTHCTKDVKGISIESVAVAMFANILIMLHGCFVEDTLVIIVAGATLLLNIYRTYQYYCFKTHSSTNTNASSTSV
jgi:uncharacterized protein with PQ loop repeat